MKVGDLVSSISPEKILFFDFVSIGKSFNPGLDWFGIIVDIEEFQPTKDYLKVKLLIQNEIVWTYSDYVNVLSTRS